jgi:excisionase family DNA binding protein
MNLNVMERDSLMQASVTQNKLAYSVEEISGFTSLSKAFLRNEIRAGNLKANRFGRRVLVLTENLRDYLNKGEKDDEK